MVLLAYVGLQIYMLHDEGVRVSFVLCPTQHLSLVCWAGYLNLAFVLTMVLALSVHYGEGQTATGVCGSDASANM